MDTLSRLRGMDRAHRRVLVWVVVAVVILALAVPVGLAVLGGRTSLSGDTTSGPVAVPGEPSPGRDQSAAGAASGGSEAAQGTPGVADKSVAPAAVTPIDTTKLVRSAWLGIEVAELTTSAGRVRAVAGAAGGRVTSENVVTAGSPEGVAKESGGPSTGTVALHEARLVLAIPSEKLDGVLTELSRLGTVSYRSSQSQDVTDTYVDTAARIKTMQAGVDRVRALLARATSLDQIVSVEAELTRRQAELEALQARLAALDKRVAESDVTVTLWTTGVKPTADDGAGFAGVMRGVWDAFLTSATVILTGLAVLLPWLLVIALVILAVRWIRRRGAAPTPSAD